MCPVCVCAVGSMTVPVLSYFRDGLMIYVTSMTTVGWNFLQGHVNNLCDFNDDRAIFRDIIISDFTDHSWTELSSGTAAGW